MNTNTIVRDFIPYPTNRVVGTIADAKHADGAVKALVQAGFDRHSIDVLHGEKDLSRLDPTGIQHGLLARLQRTLIRTGGPVEEYKHLMRHVADIRAGRFVLMVLARERESRTEAAGILFAHNADFVGFYGRWAWEELTSSGGTQVTACRGPRRGPISVRTPWILAGTHGSGRSPMAHLDEHLPWGG
jgi:hypothetical protein